METVIRVSIIFMFVLGVMRILGKRDVGQLTPFELVMLMLIPDIAQMGMTREDQSITNAIIGLSTLFSLSFLTSVLAYFSKRADKAIQGSPVVLFHNGKFLEAAMHKERVTPSELISSMHRSGYENLEQVKWAILEPDGDITFIPKKSNYHAPASADEDGEVA